MNCDLPPSDIKYLAGFIDGDGSISIVKESQKTPYYCVKLSCYNNSEEILSSFQEKYGGHILVKKQNQKEWRLKGKKAFNLVNLCKPFLILKKRQALLCKRLHLIRDVEPRTKINRSNLLNKYEEVKNQCGNLNLRGIENENKKLLASNHVSSQYLAGLIDSDGTIYFTQVHDYIKSGISISSVRKDFLEVIKGQVGGGIYLSYPGDNKRRPTFNLMLNYKQQESLIKKILPYLLVKSKKAQDLLKFFSLKRKLKLSVRNCKADKFDLGNFKK